MKDHTERETIATRIDYKLVFKKIWGYRRIYFYTLPIAFILASLYIICIPREYHAETKVAPEMGNNSAAGTLGSIASSFGFDLSEMQTTDAITPLLYPDLMDDNGFVISLLKIRIKTEELDTDYYTYLKKHQKPAFWNDIMDFLTSLFPSKDTSVKKKFDPYNLSKTDDQIVQKVRGDIKVSVDKKTGVISILTGAQDATVAKILADSTRERYQQFITTYRTNKARIDMTYYKGLMDNAKKEYEDVCYQYSKYSDSNMNLQLEAYKTKLTNLENEMQIKYNTYTTVVTQYQASKAKVQERTPAFTLVQGAAVPIKPDKPKRMLFVATMVFLAFMGTSVYVLRDIIL